MGKNPFEKHLSHCLCFISLFSVLSVLLWFSCCCRFTFSMRSISLSANCYLLCWSETLSTQSRWYPGLLWAFLLSLAAAMEYFAFHTCTFFSILQLHSLHGVSPCGIHIHLGTEHSFAPYARGM